MSRNDPFSLHTSPLNAEGCPIDPTSPVPPPWDAPPGAGVGAGPKPAGSASGRVSEIGQMLAKYSRNPELKPYEELFRAEPNEAWFDPGRSPDRPTQFEIAAVRPGRSSAYIIMDYSVIPYGFSGATALDFEPLADDRISGSFGYSLEINGASPGPLRYRLDPVRSTVRQQAVRFNQRAMQFDNITEDDFVHSQAAEYASAAGFGTGLHPQTSRRFGGRIIPFGEFVHDDQVLTIGGVVYRPIEVPLAFVQVVISGFEMGAELAKSVERALRESMR